MSNEVEKKIWEGQNPQAMADYYRQCQEVREHNASVAEARRKLEEEYEEMEAEQAEWKQEGLQLRQESIDFHKNRLNLDDDFPVPPLKPGDKVWRKLIWSHDEGRYVLAGLDLAKTDRGSYLFRLESRPNHARRPDSIIVVTGCRFGLVAFCNGEVSQDTLCFEVVKVNINVERETATVILRPVDCEWEELEKQYLPPDDHDIDDEYDNIDSRPETRLRSIPEHPYEWANWRRKLNTRRTWM